MLLPFSIWLRKGYRQYKEDVAKEGPGITVALVEAAVQEEDGKQRGEHHAAALQHLADGGAGGEQAHRQQDGGDQIERHRHRQQQDPPQPRPLEPSTGTSAVRSMNERPVAAARSQLGCSNMTS